MNVFPEQHPISAPHIINVVTLIKKFKMLSHLSTETMGHHFADGIFEGISMNE